MDAKDCLPLAKNRCTFDSDDDDSISTDTYLYNLGFLAKNRAEDRSIMCIHTVKSICDILRITFDNEGLLWNTGACSPGIENTEQPADVRQNPAIR